MLVPPRVHLRAALVAALILAAGACDRARPAAPVEEGLPLGPGATVTVATVVGEGPVAMHAWGRTVALAWTTAGPATAETHVAISEDAGASVARAVRLGEGDLTCQVAGCLAVGVGAPPASSSGRARVWVRASASDGTHTWQSVDGGRTFHRLGKDVVLPASTFPESWQVTGGTDDGAVTLRPPAPLRYVGERRLAMPALVAWPAAPPIAVDDHGALAVVWRERDASGDHALVVRRAWVDWNTVGGDAAVFDAPWTMARGQQALAPSVASVPGGIVVAWLGRDERDATRLFLRRLGLDMTCTREQATPPAPRPAS